MPLTDPALKLIPKKHTLKILLLIGLILAIILTIFIIANRPHPPDNATLPTQAQATITANEKNKYFAMTEEIFDRIKETYWNKIDDAALLNIYELAAEKILGQNIDLLFKDKKGLEIMLHDAISPMDETGKKDFTVKLSATVLANLEPFGRSGLFSQKQAAALVNTVSNVDPNADLYASIGATATSSQIEIEKLYQTTKSTLNKTLSDPYATTEEKTAAESKLALAERAKETLGNAADRTLYDENKIESTVEAQILTPEIFYLAIKKMSPATYDDFVNTVNTADADNPKLNSLILDLRGNIGGSVDLLQWLLGPFIGPGNLAFEFYHQGEYEPFKTQVGFLPSLIRYKKVVILTDPAMQSSAEIMVATLKKYHVGVVLGAKTKGWGTIEKVFPLEHQIDETEKYSVFLVHSLTLTEDNQPIEGRGIKPDIDISDKNWSNVLNQYFNDSSLVAAIKKIL